jgi:hypothetical protein
MPQVSFSKQVESWLDSKQPKTFGNLSTFFGKNSFATIFIICMAIPALPIPTGGITHVLEVVVALVALETIIGLKSLWLPKWLAKKLLPTLVIKTGLPKFIQYLRKLEKYSRPRGVAFINNTFTERFAGLAVLAFAAGAFFALPFSGLDTIVSVGAVVLSLGLVLNDISYFIAGLIVGIIGLFFEIFLGTVIAKALKRLWELGSPNLKITLATALVLLIGIAVAHHLKKRH